MLKRIAILFLISTLGACSHIYGEHGLIKSNDTAYLKEKSIAPIKIPPGLSSSTIDNFYPVSSQEFNAAQQQVDLVPPGLNS